MRACMPVLFISLTAFFIVYADTTAEEAGTGTLVEVDYGFQFKVPGPEWKVKTDYIALVLAGLSKKNSDALITITYSDFTIYDEVEVNYEYVKKLLEKNEKSTYKTTKPNYERVNLDKVILSTGEAARLEFTTENALGKWRSIITCLNSGKVVFFVSMEAREDEFNDVIDDYKALLSSIRVK